MTTSRRHLYVEIGLGAGILFGLYLTSLYGYLLFHSLVELFSIVVACGVFMIAWNSRRFMEHNYLLFLGIAYLLVGAVDLLHTLVYAGMGVFQGFGPNLSTQLWILARYTESLALLVAPVFFYRKFRENWVLVGFLLVITGLLLSIFYWNVFPTCYVEGVGLTMFKKASEYAISVILVAALVVLLLNRRRFDRSVMRWIATSIVFTIGAELIFTFYVSVYDLFNVIGHFFKLVSFYLIYKAIIETGLVKPYSLLFRDLKISQETTALRATQLESVNKELEAFTYSVSHDLRAPLRATDGYSRILLRDYAPQLPSRAQEHLNRIRSNAQQMSELIDDLLALSRIGRQALTRGSVSIADLARESLEELEHEQEGRSIEIEIRDMPSCEGDPRLLKQVMTNLLSNALRFTSVREVGRIEVGCQEEDDKVVYYVKDNGAGFDMQYADKLFGIFQRLHSVEDYPGIGVGLAIVQRIVQRHGGEVWAQAEVDKGATFYFTVGGGEPNGR